MCCVSLTVNVLVLSLGCVGGYGREGGRAGVRVFGEEGGRAGVRVFGEEGGRTAGCQERALACTRHHTGNHNWSSWTHSTALIYFLSSQKVQY